MNPKKQNRRKPHANKLEPIDWREFANDAVLNGNMSTLYRRPPSEDPSAYASAEAMVEIEKRVIRSGPDNDPLVPTVGVEPVVGARPTAGLELTAGLPSILEPYEPEHPPGHRVPLAPIPTVGPIPRAHTTEPEVVAGAPKDTPRSIPTGGEVPTVGTIPIGQTPGAGNSGATPAEAATGFLPTGGEGPTVGTMPTTPDAIPTDPTGPTVGLTRYQAGETTNKRRGFQATLGPPPTAREIPTVGTTPTPRADLLAAGPPPTKGAGPTVGSQRTKRAKPIRTVQDALTLAGQVLYRAMLGSPDASSTSCTKGYRQLAAETHLDKDTVRDLIVEFKNKGIVYETATYDPDTRLSKTYQVLSPQTVLQAWWDSGIQFVTTGRQRPLFCSAAGDLIHFTPTVGTTPTFTP